MTDLDAAIELKPVEQRIPDVATAVRCIQELINTYDFSGEERLFREDVKFSFSLLARTQQQACTQQQQTQGVDELLEALEFYLSEDEMAEGHGYGCGGPAMEKARAVIAKYKSHPAPSLRWQPIETARKADVILGYEPGGGMAVVSWMNNKWRDHHGSGLCPEFWMPLPAAPENKGETNA